MLKIKRLNIFIDESGDFGFVNGSSELYVVSFTIHESNNSISSDLEYLNHRLKKAKYDGMIHLADLVSKRGDYSNFNLKQRKEIFWSIFYFSKRVKVKIHTIIIDKKFKNNTAQLNRELALEINNFLNSINDYISEHGTNIFKCYLTPPISEKIVYLFATSIVIELLTIYDKDPEKAFYILKKIMEINLQLPSQEYYNRLQALGLCTNNSETVFNHHLKRELTLKKR